MSQNKGQPKQPYHERVAEEVIKALEEGAAPWIKPWEPGQQPDRPTNALTGRPYCGWNSVYLSMMQKGDDSRWCTYNQAKEMGAQVRKGEKGSVVQYWQFREKQLVKNDQGKPVLDEKGEKQYRNVELERPKVFHAVVFHASQIDGMPPLPPRKEKPEQERHQTAEQMLKASGVSIHHDQTDQAFYRVSTDQIHLPPIKNFPSRDKYYATVLHEVGHWTGHPSRLDRNLSKHFFGSEGYAKEELRAELASYMLGSELGIGYDPGNHISYIGSWIKALKEDPKEILRASRDAEKIVDFMRGLVKEQTLEKNRENVPGQEPVMSSERNNTRTLQGKNRKEGPEKQEKIRDGKQEKKVRTFLDVPYAEKESVKKLGAKWSQEYRSWYVPEGEDIRKFVQWKEIHFLRVPYSERQEAKELGAKWNKNVKSWYVEAGKHIEKFRKWHPDNARVLQEPSVSVRDEFRDVLVAAGCEVNGDHPVMDGAFHRIRTTEDRNGVRHDSGSASYVAYMDGHPAGYVKNFRTGHEIKWKSKGYSLSLKDREKFAAEAERKREDRKKEILQGYEESASRARSLMAGYRPLDGHKTPYIINKGIKPQSGVYTDHEGKNLYIPVVDSDGKQWSIQTIREDGNKRFMKDARKGGCFHVTGGDMKKLESAPVIALCEGYATASTCTEMLGFPVVSAFDAGNLESVATSLHRKFPDKPVLIFGDDDRHREITAGNNYGKKAALKAAEKVGGTAVFPEFAREEVTASNNLDAIAREGNKNLLSPEQKKEFDRIGEYTDFNDLAVKSRLGRKAAKDQLEKALYRVTRNIVSKKTRIFDKIRSRYEKRSCSGKRVRHAR